MRLPWKASKRATAVGLLRIGAVRTVRVPVVVVVVVVEPRELSLPHRRPPRFALLACLCLSLCAPPPQILTPFQHPDNFPSQSHPILFYSFIHPSIQTSLCSHVNPQHSLAHPNFRLCTIILYHYSFFSVHPSPKRKDRNPKKKRSIRPAQSSFPEFIPWGYYQDKTNA